MSKYINFINEGSPLEAFQVVIPYLNSEGKKRRKTATFRTRVSGEEEALRKAIEARNSLVREMYGEEALKVVSLPTTGGARLVNRNTLGSVVGVAFVGGPKNPGQDLRWVASGPIFNPENPSRAKNVSSSFSVKRYGGEVARAMAVKVRELILQRFREDSFQFFQEPEKFTSPGSNAILKEIRKKAILLEAQKTGQGEVPEDFSTVFTHTTKYIFFRSTGGLLGNYRVSIPLKSSNTAVGKKLTKDFPLALYGGEEKALKAAKRFRDYTGISVWGEEEWGRRIHTPVVREAPLASKEGTLPIGIYFETRRRGKKGVARRDLIASFPVFDPRKPGLSRKGSKRFSLAKHGEEKAFRMAIDARKEGLEIYWKARLAFLEKIKKS